MKQPEVSTKMRYLPKVVKSISDYLEIVKQSCGATTNQVKQEVLQEIGQTSPNLTRGERFPIYPSHPAPSQSGVSRKGGRGVKSHRRPFMLQ